MSCSMGARIPPGAIKVTSVCDRAVLDMLNKIATATTGRRIRLITRLSNLDGLSIPAIDMNQNPRVTRIVARIARRFNLSTRDLLPGVPWANYGKVVKQNLKVREKKHEGWRSGTRCVWPEASGGHRQDSGHRSYYTDRRESGRHGRSGQEIQDPSLDGRSRRELEATRPRSDHPCDPHSNAREAGRAVHARRQTRPDRDPHRGYSCGFRAPRESAERNRGRLHGRPHAPVQPQPSVRAQENQGGRTESPTNECSDLFLPAHEYERGRKAQELDRSPSVAPCLPHRGPLPISNRRIGFRVLRRTRPDSPGSEDRHGHGHRDEDTLGSDLHAVAFLQQQRTSGHIFPLHLR